VALLLTSAALALRLVDIGRRSLWGDEAFSWYFASKDLGEIWANGGPDPHHPPLYHTLLKWVMQVSDNEATLRSLSAVASALTVTVIFLLADRLVNRRVAVFAALLALVSPLDIWYAQEARQAAVGTLFIALAAYALTRGDLTGRLLALVAVLAAFFTYYITLIAWATILGVSVSMHWRRSQVVAREWVLVTIPALVIFLPIQGEHFVAGFADLQTSISQPFLESLMSAAGSPLVVTALAALGGAMLTALIRWLLRVAPVFTATFTAAAFALSVIASPVDRIYTLKRIVVVFWPFVVVLVAYAIHRGFSSRTSRWAQRSLLGVSIVASLVTLFVVEKDDWRTAIAAINEGSTDGDSIWMVSYVNDWSVAPYQYYGARQPLVFSVDAEGFPDLAASVPADLWIVASRTPRDPIPSTDGEAWLDENWLLIDETPVHRLSVRHYGPPAS
jgi:uncharacterized membrane protein